MSLVITKQVCLDKLDLTLAGLPVSQTKNQGKTEWGRVTSTFITCITRTLYKLDIYVAPDVSGLSRHTCIGKTTSLERSGDFVFILKLSNVGLLLCYKCYW